MMLRRVTIALCLVLSLRTFQFFPGFSLVQEAWFIVAAVVSVLLIPTLFRRQVGCSPSLEAYIVLLALATPLWAGLTALSSYGQPLVFGVLSQRHVSLLGVVLLFTYAMSRGAIGVVDLHRSLLALGWGTLGLYLAMGLGLDAGAYVEYGKAFVEDRGPEGYRFRFMTFFIVYVMFASFIRGWRGRRPVFFLVALALFAYLVGDTGGRVFTAATAASLLVLAMRWNGALAALSMAAALATTGALMLAMTFAVDADTALDRIARFGEAAAVFTADPDLSDPSAMARVWQTLTALPYIESSPWLGNGNISYKWSDEGFAGVVDEYFYPADIGIVGMVYMFGLLGTALYALQFRWGLRRATVARRVRPAHDTSVAMLIYIGISSLATGQFVLFPETSLLMVVMAAASAGLIKHRAAHGAVHTTHKPEVRPA